MDNVKMYPDYRINRAAQSGATRAGNTLKCSVNDIADVSAEIILRKRISLILLLAFIPLLTALYLITSNFNVNATYMMALALTYGVYYLFYSIWACSSHCPACGKVMSKKYLFILPLLTCGHCGHDLKHPAKAHNLTI